MSANPISWMTQDYGLHVQKAIGFPGLVGNKILPWVATIALWFCPRLPSCGRGFESQAYRLHFFQFVLLNL